MYDNDMIMSLKQKEIKLKPRIKLNNNIYNSFDCRRSITSQAFATLEKGGELWQKCVPKLFLGSLRGTSWSAIGQFPFLSLVTVPQFFATVRSVQFPFRSKMANVTGAEGGKTRVI